MYKIKQVDYSDAIQKLNQELFRMQEIKDQMKYINAEYEKHNGDIEKIYVSDKVKKSLLTLPPNTPPFELYQLMNMSQKMVGITKKIEGLKQMGGVNE